MKIQWVGALILLLCCCEAKAKECTYGEPSGLLSRVVAIDSANGPVYTGAKADIAGATAPLLVLNNKEIVLTFDQGPHSAYTKNILDILDHNCVKATFFFTGSAALANPTAVRDVAHRGHTLAAGPWSASAAFDTMTLQSAKMEVEKGLSAVAKASNEPIAPFFRVRSTVTPGVQDYLKERGVSLWYFDIASGDADEGLTATKFANRTLARIQEAGKGVIQFHDTRKVTVDALDSILTNLRLQGFKVVQIVPSTNFTPKDEYLAELAKPTVLTAEPSRASRHLVESAKRRVREAEPDSRRVRRPEQSSEMEQRRAHRAVRESETGDRRLRPDQQQTRQEQ